MTRTYGTFEASGFPDDSEWTKNGSPLVPEGRAVAEAIVASLRQRGLKVDQPVQHEFYGWSFNAWVSSRRYWCVLQYVSPWLLIVESAPTLVERFFTGSGDDALKKAAAEVGAALLDRPDLSSLKWFTREEYERTRKRALPME